VTFGVDASSTSFSIVKCDDLLMTSDGRKTVNGILMRSSERRKKNQLKTRLIFGKVI
jgi:hypothetical protein